MMTKQEKNDFLNDGGTLIRKVSHLLMIKAKTKDRDWHYFRKLSTHQILDKEFEDLLKRENFKTDV